PLSPPSLASLGLAEREGFQGIARCAIAHRDLARISLSPPALASLGLAEPEGFQGIARCAIAHPDLARISLSPPSLASLGLAEREGFQGIARCAIVASRLGSNPSLSAIPRVARSRGARRSSALACSYVMRVPVVATTFGSPHEWMMIHR